MNAPLPTEQLQAFGKKYQEYLRRVAKKQQSKRGWYDEHGIRQDGLIAFVRYFWSVIEPARNFVDGWPLWAMCEHLEAVTFGEITRLLINVPPGFMKSLLTDVFWPAWEWGPMGLTHYRYVAFSYSASLTERDNDRFRTLITSEAYQRLYGPMRYRFDEKERESTVDGVVLRNKTTIKVMNTKTGWKLASSVGGVATGERGDRIIIDDPHAVQEAESERVRDETVRWFRESISSRFNDLDTGALVIIMQRVHESDVAGVALGKQFDYCHLMIPWNFDPLRQCDADGEPIANQIGWTDPRTKEDEPAWLDRFGPDGIARLQREADTYAWASQYQQSPMPRGGGILKREWWKLWDPPDGKFPPFDYVFASLDGAFTEKEQNDPSALTVWGTFTLPSTTGGEMDPETGHLWQTEDVRQRKIMLIHAWRKRLEFSAERSLLEGKPNESHAIWRQRTMQHWGLLEWVQDTCTRFRVDRLLVEAKANGISVAQEMRNRYGLQEFAIELVQVSRDKVARALAIQPTLAQGMVYAPDREWADMVIREAEVFPFGKHDDLTDSMTQALKHLRDRGFAQTQEEITHEERERVTHRPQRKKLYQV